MIYHITSQAEWNNAQESGSYTAPSLEREGFIHCSTRAQILDVANAFYRGQNDLVLLCINPDNLTSTLKWEDPAHPNPDSAPATTETEQFPHIYGAIALDAVSAVIPFPEGEEGFALPPNLPS